MSDIKTLIDYLNPRKTNTFSSYDSEEYLFVRIDQAYITSNQDIHSEDVTSVRRKELKVEPFGPYLEVPSSFNSLTLYTEFNSNNTNYYFQKEINGTTKYLTLQNIVDGNNSNSFFEEFDDQNFTRIQSGEALVYHTGQERLFSIFTVLPEIQITSKRTLSYNQNELGGLTNGRYDLNFKDATGYTNGFWDQLLDTLSKGSAATYLPPSNKRVTLLKLNSQKGELYWYPKLEYTIDSKVRLTYNYHPQENDNLDLIDHPYAIQIDFVHFEGFLAFMNLVYFNNGISPFGIHNDSGQRKVNLLINYVQHINAQLKKSNISLSQQLTYIYYIPSVFFIKKQTLFARKRTESNILGKDFIWKILASALEGSVNNSGVNTEDIVLKLLNTLKVIQDYSEEGKEITTEERKIRYDYILNQLLERKTPEKKSFLNALYNKLNTDDFIAYNTFIYQLWSNSSFTDPSNPIFKDTSPISKKDEEPKRNKVQPQLLLPYKTDKILGFYTSNLNFEFNDKENIIVTPDESAIGNTVRGLSPAAAFLIDSISEADWQSEYHPLQPVYLADPNKDKAVELQALSPMLLLKANEDKSFWNNVATTSEYAFDALSTLSGIGNLAKFRHLSRIVKTANEINKNTKLIKSYKIYKGAKGIAAGVEITSGAVNILLKASGINDSEFGKALGEYLFWLELLSLSGEATVAIVKGLQKSSLAMLKKPDLLLKIEKETLKEFTEAALQKLSKGAQEGLVVIKELLIQARIIIEESLTLIKNLPKALVDDLNDLGVQLFNVLDREADALKRFLYNEDPLALEFALANGSKIDNIVVHEGKAIFSGTKKQLDAFADTLKKSYGNSGKKGLKNKLDELAENLSLTHKDVLRKRNLKIEKGNAQIYVDLIEVINGKKVIRFRGSKEEMNNVMRVLSKSDDEIKKTLDNIVDETRIKKGFNPQKDALQKLRQEGVFIKKSSRKRGFRGLVPDFLSTPQFLYKGNKDYGIIKIKLTGVDDLDFRAAYEAAGLLGDIPKGKKKISDYTWHHMDDYDPITGTCTMQLVKTDIHKKTATHIGGMGLLNKLFDVVRK